MDQTGRMKEIWGKRTPGTMDAGIHKHAAVILPLIDKNDSLHVLFEVRAGKLNTQPGEVCFPGGAVEEGESPEDAAVRETKEELLISRGQIDMLAPLDRLLTPASITIYPFLGALIKYENTFSADEVDHVFTVPLAFFLNNCPEVYHTAVRTFPDPGFPYEWIPGGEKYKWRQGNYDVLFYQYEDNIIWGMTARIVYSFAEMCRGELLGGK